MFLNLIHSSSRWNTHPKRLPEMSHSPWSLLNIPVDISCSFLCIPIAFGVSLSHNPHFRMPCGMVHSLQSSLLCETVCSFGWEQNDIHLCIPAGDYTRQALHGCRASGESEEQSAGVDTGCPTGVWVCFPKFTLK